jgi:hypothetical protein
MGVGSRISRHCHKDGGGEAKKKMVGISLAINPPADCDSWPCPVAWAFLVGEQAVFDQNHSLRLSTERSGWRGSHQSYAGKPRSRRRRSRSFIATFPMRGYFTFLVSNLEGGGFFPCLSGPRLPSAHCLGP